MTKVHVQARRYAEEGYTIILIGHAGHEEVVGTTGEAPDATILVQTVEEAEALDLPGDAKLAYVTQTTLSVDKTGEIIKALRLGGFPRSRAPRKEDICYATSNRQWAVKEMLPEIDLLLVIGSRNSSNSNRLVETARAAGTAAYLIDDETEIDERWLPGGRDRRHHLGRIGSGEARRTRLRLVPRTRRDRHRVVQARRGGRDVPAPGRTRRELELAAQAPRDQSFPRPRRRGVCWASGAAGGWFGSQELAGDRDRRRDDDGDDDRGDGSALPEAVEETRAQLLEAAASGNYEALRPLIPTEGGFTYTFGGPVDGGPIAYWQQLERESNELPARDARGRAPDAVRPNARHLRVAIGVRR